jgi:type IV pilus assembly protein PilP
VLIVVGWLTPLVVSALPLETESGAAEPTRAQRSPNVGHGNDAPYDPTGKRDPFRPYVQPLDGPAATSQRTPLQQYELSQLRLVAIVSDQHDPRETRAVVEDSSGLGYIIRMGTPIGRNNGRVTAIERNRVVVEEWPSNVFGERRRIVTVKELDAGEEAKR